jgi:hypothetical protein
MCVYGGRVGGRARVRVRVRVGVAFYENKANTCF